MGVESKCGLAVSSSLSDTHLMMREGIQHRGKDAAGIGGMTADGKIVVVKWAGPANRFDTQALHSIFENAHPFDSYRLFFGHVRYKTTGREEFILDDAHPHTIDGVQSPRNNHVIITDATYAAIHNGQVELADTPGVHISDCDTAVLLRWYRDHDERALLREIPGAYTLGIADGNRKEFLVMRDRTGIKPGFIGAKGNRFVMASEDSALALIGAEAITQIQPGSLCTVDLNGYHLMERVVDAQPRHCFFEWNYVAHRKSTLERLAVRGVREALGRALAYEHRPEADFVTFVPRCPEDAAIAYAEEAGMPFHPIFYKPDSTRVFQGPNQVERRQTAKEKIFLLPGAEEKLAGKTVILVDDSMVRGTNIQHTRDLVLSAGAKEAILLSYTPPIGVIGDDGEPRGCNYGVDMAPTSPSFVARDYVNNRNRTIDEISAAINMRVGYLSSQRMVATFAQMGLPLENLCTYCIGGSRPFEPRPI